MFSWFCHSKLELELLECQWPQCCGIHTCWIPSWCPCHFLQAFCWEIMQACCENSTEIMLGRLTGWNGLTTSIAAPFSTLVYCNGLRKWSCTVVWWWKKETSALLRLYTLRLIEKICSIQLIHFWFTENCNNMIHLDSAMVSRRFWNIGNCAKLVPWRIPNYDLQTVFPCVDLTTRTTFLSCQVRSTQRQRSAICIHLPSLEENVRWRSSATLEITEMSVSRQQSYSVCR